MTDRERLELAAKAAGITEETQQILEAGINGCRWNPLDDDGDALRLAVKLRINIIFSGGFHYVGMNRYHFDICCLGGMDAIRWEIVNEAAKIGKDMP